MSNSLKDAFLNLGSALGHCQENSRSIVDALKRGCSDLADNAEGGGGGSSQDYSTTEHVVGKWIDGTTDVYEITIVLDEAVTLVNQSWTSTGKKSGSIDQILNAIAYNYSDNLCVPVIATSKGGSSDDEIAFLQTRNQNISINAFTVRYTKA